VHQVLAQPEDKCMHVTHGQLSCLFHLTEELWIPPATTCQQLLDHTHQHALWVVKAAAL
jgi:hypothetical protein